MDYAQHIQLAVFDMAGTTVRDQSEVENCFKKAADETGLPTTMDRIKDMQGIPKLIVVETLWHEAIGNSDPGYQQKVTDTYQRFTEILENHYKTEDVLPAEGAMEILTWMKDQGIKVCLTTGFYRKVTNIILDRLGWNVGLNQQYRAVSSSALIDLSLTPDETGRGRPHPDMINMAMDLLGIKESKLVLKIGDTPSDLLAGANAKVGFNLAVTNGTHSRAQLEAYPHDALLNSISEMPSVLGQLINQRI